MMRFMTLLALVGLLFVVGCEDKKPATPPAKPADTSKMEDATKKAGEAAGDAIKKAGEEGKKAADTAADAIKDATDNK